MSTESVQHTTAMIIYFKKPYSMVMLDVCFYDPRVHNIGKVLDPDETRTRNLLIRSQTPYPLGHRAIQVKYCTAPLFYM